jgi:hypothetical protein
VLLPPTTILGWNIIFHSFILFCIFYAYKLKNRQHSLAYVSFWINSILKKLLICIINIE